tara:strand:+ start:2209 stop:2352 length:144 start_codon:yes stop_codon:yes gene_type:complete
VLIYADDVNYCDMGYGFLRELDGVGIEIDHGEERHALMQTALYRREH